MVKEREIPFSSPITIPLSLIPSKQTNATIAFLPWKGMHIHITHHHSIVPRSFDAKEYETIQKNTKRCKRIQYCIQSTPFTFLTPPPCTILLLCCLILLCLLLLLLCVILILCLFLLLLHLCILLFLLFCKIIEIKKETWGIVSGSMY